MNLSWILLAAASLSAHFTGEYARAADWQEPDWSREAEVSGESRANLYRLPPGQLERVVTRGREHAVHYPVEPTGILIPWNAFKDFMNHPEKNPLRRFLQGIFKDLAGFESTDEVFDWLGLQRYPEYHDARPIYQLPPAPAPETEVHHLGVTLRQRHGEQGFTLGCATCHSGALFGKVVLGLTNRFPRANAFFESGIQASERVTPGLFDLILRPKSGESRQYRETHQALAAVGTKEPAALGLDTSLAQVALSLNHRNPDSEASRNPRFEKNPRPDSLDSSIADSKPAVWWNLKYKTRWLSDGSIVSGNPIFTNFIWNEIGRGVDLPSLERWLASDADTVRELTAAVFATEAPRITDFFPAERIPLAQAQRGQKIYQESCARCHGVYEKAWDQSGSEHLAAADRLVTTRVRYFEQTPVKDVGTDPQRARGMQSLAEKLNPLRISQVNGILIEPQRGYVPPPLVGIWARWPYLHNNSVPSLCALLTRASDRPRQYQAGEARDPERDFDLDCNGYPQGDAVPEEWKGRKERLFDASRPGLRNSGHDEGIFLDQGQERLTREQKLDLIRFLQTL